MTSPQDESKTQNLFTESAYYQPTESSSTSMLSDVEDRPSPPANRYHGGIDFGLLALRLALGVILGAHGLQKVFGLFGGPGIDGTARMLEAMGYTAQPTLLAWITGLSELIGAVLVVLGLFTQIGAAAILGVTVNMIYVQWSSGFFEPNGFEFELLLATVAFALLFTGSGRIALDVNTPWRRRPVPFGLFFLLIAAAAAVVVIVLAR
ncbi:DoxX family protein [Amycolatopsis methanolica]|uniref:DoxX family protein n=1 Tax=Amycolatopsis methanolica 239 TaxID=1068978 RepID=A0A076MS15_AMYME|nr:DoxX family protein [Amycolatopsis methanolica]AIJ21590.1 DoxX family protein [Amycolatopsis methanolica 239]